MGYGDDFEPLDWPAIIAALFVLIMFLLVFGQLILWSCVRPWC